MLENSGSLAIFLNARYVISDRFKKTDRFTIKKLSFSMTIIFYFRISSKRVVPFHFFRLFKEKIITKGTRLSFGRFKKRLC